MITDPKEALNVMDFEEAAHRKVLPGHWAYMASGVDDDVTLRANREGYRHVQLRPRRLRDATKVDMRTELFGTVYNSPIFTCPTGGERSFSSGWRTRGGARHQSARNHADAFDRHLDRRGGRERAHGRPVWYQLYAPNTWEACEKIVRRVEAAGCPVIALTVDNTTGRNSETYLRTRPKDLGQCAACHEGAAGPSAKERKMYDGIDMTGVGTQNPAMTWEFVDRLRKAITSEALYQRHRYARGRAPGLEHGIDGILVSNHGGRSTETGRATIEALPEVVSEVGGRIPVFVDGGVRRGTDVFKALALGAKAVGIGRPFLGDWERSGRLASTGSSKFFKAS